MSVDERLYETFPVQEINSTGGVVRLADMEKSVIGEISLKIFINGTEYASLLCLNQFAPELAVGFLYSEGVIDTMADVASLTYNDRLFAVIIELVPGKSVAKSESLRSVTSGCGKCFTYINPMKNEKYQTIDCQRRYSLSHLLLSMKRFEQQSVVYRRVGGVHSVLFHHHSFAVFIEDIGRHNCFDKITGILLTNDKMQLVRDSVFFVSGRVSSEIITKVIRLGVPVLVSRSTPTAAAVNLAAKYGVTLLGYVRNGSGYVYSGKNRLIEGDI